MVVTIFSGSSRAWYAISEPFQRLLKIDIKPAMKVAVIPDMDDKSGPLTCLG
jgi:hypothetical protein